MMIRVMGKQELPQSEIGNPKSEISLTAVGRAILHVVCPPCVRPSATLLSAAKSRLLLVGEGWFVRFPGLGGFFNPMKTSAALILIVMLGAGCNTTTFSETRPDGTQVRVTNCRAFWSSETYAATIGTNGASLTANKSSVESAAIAAAVQGAIQGAALVK
jgi:hypothetical protein